MKTKFIFVTGGVCSSLGKGVASASLGCLLESRGLKVTLQKFDPYINVDPGTMNPFQHGEVYVTDDGAETDLDLGYYERFTSTSLSRLNSVSTGQIYDSVIRRERHGGYLGQTVQVIPHITDEIKLRVHMLAEAAQPDVQIIEIGGTVGDIEGVPFLEAIRQFGLDVGRRNALFIHLTLVPYIGAAGELKSKPTQHSVKELREIGIMPDILLCRASRELSADVRRKIALFGNVCSECVFSATDIKTSIYEIPAMLHQQDLDGKVIELLGLEAASPNLTAWNETVNRIVQPDGEVTIALCGKYVELQDAYRSIHEALVHGGSAHRVRVNFRRIDAEELEHHPAEEVLAGVDGILVPGGFGARGFEGKISAVEFARTHNVPYLGICYGMHAAVIEFARHVCGMEGANTTENDKNTPYPVISLLREQETVVDLGGTMRLGAFPCTLAEGTISGDAYGETDISERHRHRYEFNNKYEKELTEAGLTIAGRMPGTGLVEIIEVKGHPWFVAVQFHPEFKSRPRVPHPLFAGFVGAAVRKKNGTLNESLHESSTKGLKSPRLVH